MLPPASLNPLVCVCVLDHPFRANAFAERLRLGLAVIHGEPKQDQEIDGRHSPPPVTAAESTVALEGHMAGAGQIKANLLSVVAKEKPPLSVVGDIHGKIAIIVVSVSFMWQDGHWPIAFVVVSCQLQFYVTADCKSDVNCHYNNLYLIHLISGLCLEICASPIYVHVYYLLITLINWLECCHLVYMY